MPGIQTLDHTETHIKGDQDLRGSARCLCPWGRRERSIDYLHKITRELQLVLSRTHSEINHHPKIGFITSILREKKKPSKQFQVRYRNSSHSTVGRPLQVHGWPLGRPLNAFCYCRTYWKCRSIGRFDPTGFLLLVQHRSIERSTDPSLVHVGRPPGQPKSCEFKKLYLLFLLSLHRCSLSSSL